MNRKLAEKYQLLSEYTEAFIDRLAGVDPEILQHKLDSNTWSPIQVLDHLVMAERVSNSYIKKKYNAIQEVPTAGIKSTVGCYAMKISQKMAKKYKAPSYISQPDNDQTLDEIKLTWSKVRTELFDFLKNYPDKYEKKALFKHPFIGRLSLAQMMDIHLMHLQRHEKQIDERVKNFTDSHRV